MLAHYSPWFTSWGGAVAVLSLADFGLNLAVTQFLAIATATAPARSTASFAGAVNGLSVIGGTASPLVTGYLVEATGSFASSFALSGVMLVVVVVCFVFGVTRIEPLPGHPNSRSPRIS